MAVTKSHSFGTSCRRGAPLGPSPATSQFVSLKSAGVKIIHSCILPLFPQPCLVASFARPGAYITASHPAYCCVASPAAPRHTSRRRTLSRFAHPAVAGLHAPRRIVADILRADTYRAVPSAQPIPNRHVGICTPSPPRNRMRQFSRRFTNGSRREELATPFFHLACCL